MNPYGFGQGVSHRYPPGIALTKESHTTQPSAQTHATDVGNSQAGRVEGATQSFDYSRGVIPGLGLTPSHDQPAQQNTLGSLAPPTAPLNPQPSYLPRAEPGREGERVGNDNFPIPSNVPGPTTQTSEEGELSDGELEEDFYEPREPDANELSRYGQHQPSSNHPYPAYAGQQVKNPQQGHFDDIAAGGAGMARERSGSYSPYLSPREMNSGQSGSPYSARGISPSPYKAGDDTPTLSTEPKSALPINPSTGSSAAGLPKKTLMQAKKDAEEAIISLLPFKVGYQDYIAEGIDPTILRDLFTSLNLEIGMPSEQTNAPPQTDNTPQTDPTAQPKPSSASVASKSPPANMASATTGDANKPEERKDKIARLLAAKASSKPAAPPVIAPPAVALPPKPANPSANAKTQAEKSKLLHQKMEALRKSREEALAKKAAEVVNEASPIAKVTEDAIAGSSSLDVDRALTETREDGPLRVDSGSEADAQASSSIPGLFLSSTLKQPSTTGSTHKRPVAADLNDLSPVPAKRPFGQKRDSRPFLIDVSDDEDDAEMEIDSPEMRPTTLPGQATPSEMTPLSRDAVQQESQISRSIASPASLPTPPQVPPTGSYGRPNLQNMNKKIEEMKRKIAEAEARKRARQSRQGSMTPSQPNGFSDVDSPDIGPVAQLPHAPASPMISSGSRDNGSEGDLWTLDVSKRSGPAGRSREDRLQRSRAASERLSVVEALRRQQLLKLELLRGQVTDLEKSIEDSRFEEERLKKEVAASLEVPPEPEATTALDRSRPVSGEVFSKRFPPQSDIVASELTRTVEEGPPPGQTSSPSSDAMETSTTPASSTDADADADVDADVDADADADVSTADAEPMSTLVGGQEDNVPAEDPVPDIPASSARDEPATLEQMTENHVGDHLQPLPAGDPPAVSGDSDHEGSMNGEEAMDEGDSEDMSDIYEPSDAEPSASMSHSPSHAPPADSPHPSMENHVLSGDEHSGTDTSASPAQPVQQQLPLGQQELSPDLARKAPEAAPYASSGPNLTIEQADASSASEDASQGRLAPYKTPLHYFLAFRFHPSFRESVPGGIRSLTYSNKINVHKALCPDQLDGRQCPREEACQFQHLEAIQASDSEIIIQLTEYGKFEGERRQEYIYGLTRLLSDLRSRDVADLDAISQGIIEFRAQFLGDQSRVLPLGSVSL